MREVVPLCQQWHSIGVNPGDALDLKFWKMAGYVIDPVINRPLKNSPVLLVFSS